MCYVLLQLYTAAKYEWVFSSLLWIFFMCVMVYTVQLFYWVNFDELTNLPAPFFLEGFCNPQFSQASGPNYAIFEKEETHRYELILVL